MLGPLGTPIGYLSVNKSIHHSQINACISFSYIIIIIIIFIFFSLGRLLLCLFVTLFFVCLFISQLD